MSAVMEEKTFRGLREIAVLGFFAVALFLLISLITFSNEDAGWTHSGTVQKITNTCGVFGAWLADFTLSFFGLMAYLFPFIIFWHGYLLYGKTRPKQQKMTIALQGLGSLAIIISGAALFPSPLMPDPMTRLINIRLGHEHRKCKNFRHHDTGAIDCASTLPSPRHSLL